MYKPEVLRHHIERYGFCSPRNDMNLDDLNLLCFDKKIIEKSEFFNASVDTRTIEQAWIKVMTD